jgi:hypothetical protein
LLNGAIFDFDLGYENLYSITIYDTGTNKSRLVFDYRTSTPLMPNETLIIDPTFGYTGASFEKRIQTNFATGAACPSASYSEYIGGEFTFLGKSGLAEQCIRTVLEWDTTAIPDSSTITNVNLRYDVTATPYNVRNCDFMAMANQPSISTNAINYVDAGDGTTYVNNNAGCTTIANDKILDLGTSADTDLQSLLAANWFGLGIKLDNEVRDANYYGQSESGGSWDLEVTYTLPLPDAVDDLISPTQSYGVVDLTWTQPNLNTGNASGYQINYTTPYGNPLTIITNNTGTATTSTAVTGLSVGTPYTFGVSVWTENGNNATHPPMTWFNITTAGNFTIGTAVFNQTNPFVLPITFEEQTVDDTTEFLNVTFSNTFDLACDFHYKFANTNQTYSSLTSYAVSSTLNETSFVFTNGTNEIIDVYCWDQITDTNARYLLKQSDFPLLDEILGFRNGEYGTQGRFGVFDLVTLLVIIGSMIGLNRENESVGIVFNIMLMFGLAAFQIIELTTVIFGMIALVLVFVITSTKKS